MTRIIRIERCDQCLSRDHHGAFGQVAYVPVCRQASRDLPYTIRTNGYGRSLAIQTKGIPDWCPLEKLPEPS